MSTVSPFRTPTPVRRSALLRAAGGATVAVLIGTLVACAGSSGGTGSPNPAAVTASAPVSAAPAGGAGGGQNGRTSAGVRPAAFGVIAALSAGSMQVQSTSAQTTVRYTAATRFTQTSPSSLAAVKVGSCVTASAAVPAADAGGATTGGSAQPPTSRPAVTALTAVSVELTVPTAAGCPGGFGAFGGGPGAGTRPTGTRPTGTRPTGGPVPSGSAGAPTAGGRGFGAFGTRTVGTVLALTGNTIVVQQAARTGASATTKVTVTVTGTTVYTSTGPAKATALKVGLCAVAIGKADSTGAVSADSVALSPSQAGGCTAGFGAGGGRFGGRNGRPGTGSGPVTTNG